MNHPSPNNPDTAISMGQYPPKCVSGPVGLKPKAASKALKPSLGTNAPDSNLNKGKPHPGAYPTTMTDKGNANYGKKTKGLGKK